MKIIDAHMHFSRIHSLKDFAVHRAGVDYSASGFEREATDCGIVAAVCMGLSESSPGANPCPVTPTPMLADLEPHLPRGVALMAGINPHRLDDACLQALKTAMRERLILGIKIYAGYYHFDVNDPIYTPVYRLAEEYGLPVAIHSGDTFSERGLLEYARPLSVDRLAVTWRRLSFIICHLGSPWCLEACEVAFKNHNVFVDLSGLLCGSAAEVAELAAERLWTERFQQALLLLDGSDQILFGSDWPLTPLAAYIDFCKRLVPQKNWPAVFHDNAARLFGL